MWKLEEMSAQNIPVLGGGEKGGGGVGGSRLLLILNRKNVENAFMKQKKRTRFGVVKIFGLI